MTFTTTKIWIFFPYLVFQIHKNAKPPVGYTCHFSSCNTTQNYRQNPKGEWSWI